MAIVTFRSNAAGEILMFRETAEAIFKIIGKPLGLRGVLTVEELPEAIKSIKHQMEKEKAIIKEETAKEDKQFRQFQDLDQDDKKKREKPIFFTQRVYPLLEMMEFSLKDKVPVMWD
ncbi:MAG: DUF1840 domain-containing protein [Burkholderiales bacterium]|nr:DUF1840 domain-containing protein [Burkholderiales bacterium]